MDFSFSYIQTCTFQRISQSFSMILLLFYRVFLHVFVCLTCTASTIDSCIDPIDSKSIPQPTALHQFIPTSMHGLISLPTQPNLVSRQINAPASYVSANQNPLGTEKRIDFGLQIRPSSRNTSRRLEIIFQKEAGLPSRSFLVQETSFRTTRKKGGRL